MHPTLGRFNDCNDNYRSSANNHNNSNNKNNASFVKEIVILMLVLMLTVGSITFVCPSLSSNKVRKACQGPYFRMSALLNMAPRYDDLWSKSKKTRCFCAAEVVDFDREVLRQDGMEAEGKVLHTGFEKLGRADTFAC